MDEVSLALDRRKRIVPILIRQCNVPFRLRRLQYVDFTAGYDAGLAALVGALNSQRQAGQEQAQTSDGAMPVSSQGPSGFAAPLLNAARVDFDLTRGPRPFPAQVCASRVGSRCCGRGSCACSEAIEPSARARCHTAAVRPRFRRQEAGQLLCRRVGEYGSRNSGNHEAEHPSRRAEICSSKPGGNATRPTANGPRSRQRRIARTCRRPPQPISAGSKHCSRRASTNP